MSNAELANAIGSFIEKYQEKVYEGLNFGFKIKGIHKISVSESSLKEVRTNLWTFEASADLLETDERETLEINRMHTAIVGNATVGPHVSHGIKEEVVLDVKITHIK